MLHDFHYFPLLLLIMNYKCATMLSCDIISCKGGHLEKRKPQQLYMNMYEIRFEKLIFINLDR